MRGVGPGRSRRMTSPGKRGRVAARLDPGPCHPVLPERNPTSSRGGDDPERAASGLGPIRHRPISLPASRAATPSADLPRSAIHSRQGAGPRSVPATGGRTDGVFAPGGSRGASPGRVVPPSVAGCGGGGEWNTRGGRGRRMRRVGGGRAMPGQARPWRERIGVRPRRARGHGTCGVQPGARLQRRWYLDRRRPGIRGSGFRARRKTLPGAGTGALGTGRSSS